MTWLRFALLLIVVAVCFPARVGAWLVSEAHSSSASGPECDGAAPDQGDTVLAADTSAESDDDGEWDGESGVLPLDSAEVRAARSSLVWVPRSGLMASSGIPGSLFRPPRAIA